MAISLNYLRSQIRYDPETGLLWWIEPKKGRQRHKPVGCPMDSTGHLTLMLDGKSYLAHVLIWFLVTGEWPENEIDHRDRVGSNNKWVNLRPATHRQNCGNKRTYVTNELGERCIQKYRNGFRVRVGARNRHIGVFKTLDKARAARDGALAATFGEFGDL